MTEISIEGIETEKGNEILAYLRTNGWVISSQYSPLAFDKGIDFDRYCLEKNSESVTFEWDNWFEWTISGPKPLIEAIAHTYELSKT